tara:strand:- start:2043 stop:3356 length:1314 start_codon:yes stop_codon:yes gene_type:complete
MVFYNPGRTSEYSEDQINSGYRYHYLGGGNEVGNVGVVLEDKTKNRLLLDYGIAPTSPPKYPKEAPFVKNAIITHSHVDHLGMAPWLPANYNTNLHGTELTAEISRMMWNDCYKISSIEKYPLPWDKRDIDIAMDSWITHDFNDSWMQENWKLTLLNAGHIPGAGMLKVETDDKNILFTGDFDTRNSPLTKGAKPEDVDILFIEGTYGGRNHADQELELSRFIDNVIRVTDNGGTILIPAFANGRTQDMMMRLHQNCPELDVHIDGMGKRITKLHLEHNQFLRNPSALNDAWNWSKRVSSKSDRKKALEADVIISTSGMLQGGPAIWYLNRLRHNMENEIFFTGYQAKDTGGRKLQTKSRLDIFGKEVNIPLNWEKFSFSTHAGHKEITEFVYSCDPQDVIIYHTDPNNSRPHLVEELESNGINTHSPENGHSYIIE